MVDKLRSLLEGKNIKRDEKGLALLDVLIGMAIFALIAVIAVTAISQYRERAYESGAVSDAKAVALQLEADFTDGGAYPTPDATATDGLRGTGFEGNLTGNNEVVAYTVSDEHFIVCVGEEGKGIALFNSKDGTVVDKARGDGTTCAALNQGSTL